jgi:hypothetical protein
VASIDPAFDPTETSILHANLSMAHTSMKGYAKALDEADKSLKLNHEYLKAYYRKAQALQGLNRLVHACCHHT